MKDIFNALKTINYWNAKPRFKLGFNRRMYLNQIKPAFNNKLIKVLVGQRRTGKSYMIRQLINYLIEEKNHPAQNIFYLNKEMYEFDLIVDAQALDKLIAYYEAQMKPEGKIYIFIDEIQDIINWEKIISSLAQHPVKDYEVFITGSNSKLLSGELASQISGRYVVYEIFPFSFPEFLDFYSLATTKENLIKYIETSGLPETFNLESDEIRKHYFQSLKDTILLKDIMYRHKIRDYVLLGDVFLFLLHNIGNLSSVSSIIKYFKSKNRKTDYTTLSSYLSYMEDAYIIRQSPRYQIKTKELLSGEKKYYLNDLGFGNYLFPQFKKEISYILENIVFNHLRLAGYNVFTGNDKNHEIDFVAEKNNTYLYVQVCYLLASEETINREFRPLEAIHDNFRKIVVSLDDILIRNKNGIEHQNIMDFITSIIE